MRNAQTPALPSTAPRQLSMTLESRKLRGMNSAERGTTLMRLASMLLEAAGVAVRERDDDER
jgi:hypothetical protein